MQSNNLAIAIWQPCRFGDGLKQQDRIAPLERDAQQLFAVVGRSHGNVDETDLMKPKLEKSISGQTFRYRLFLIMWLMYSISIK